MGLVGCPGSSGLSKEDPCSQTMAIKCEQISTCGGVNALTSLGYSSADDCTKGLQAANCTSAQAAACEAGVGGLEFLSGVPGTIGGAIRMNAGAYGRELVDVLEKKRAS